MNVNDAIDPNTLPTTPPSPDLEDRVVQQLHDKGLLGNQDRRAVATIRAQPLRKTLVAAAGAGIALFASGVFTGQWLEAAGPAPSSPASQEWALNELAPDAALGFGLSCRACMFDEGTATWRFDEQPQVDRIAPGTKAHDWGIASAARLVAVDGIAITTEEGGQKFSAIKPGDSVVWTFDRYGVEREMTTVAMNPSEAEAARQVLSTGDAASDSLRLIYSQRVGAIRLEVRVDPDEPGRALIIEPGRQDEVVVRLGREEIRIRPVGER